jgi:hypothetical protein
MLKDNKKFSEKSIIDIGTILILTMTMLFVGWQAFETSHSVKLFRQGYEIQNRPYVSVMNVTYRSNEITNMIETHFNIAVFGSTPAHELFVSDRILFYIQPSQNILKYIDNNKNDLKKSGKSDYYLNGLIKEIAGFVKSNPDFNEIILKAFLKNWEKKPPRVKIKLEQKEEEINLKIDGFHVYKEEKDINIAPLFITPKESWRFFLGRKGSDIIKDIKNFKKVLFCYVKIQYEAIDKDKKYYTYYLGFIDGRRILKLQIPKFPNESLIQEKDEKIDVYSFNLRRMWLQRTP